MKTFEFVVILAPNTVHNVQAGTRAENLVALYEAVREAR